jgi:UDP-N-acetyl-D-glucosamine dehydrogenase
MQSRGRLVIVGQGYVGLPIAMRAVAVGYSVVGLDVDAQRIQRLRNADSYVEDVLDSDLRAALASGRYLPSDDAQDCANFDFAIVTVPTPLHDTLPDLSFIESSARTLAQFLKPGATVVLESTTYPGTTEELFVPLLESGSGLSAGADFHVGYSPERIDPGNLEYTFVTTPKVISGIDSASLVQVHSLYTSLVDRVVTVSSTKEAELTKLLENTFRHVNIALVNELAIFAKELGIDVWEAIDAASTKPFGYMRFTPGPGVGGHCLPVDPSYLSWQVKRTLGHNFRFVELANDVNEHMPDYVVRRLTRGLNAERKSLNGSRILLIGLSYKKNTGDVRESPAMRVADLLYQQGADLYAVDPFADANRLKIPMRLVTLTTSEIANADAIVVLTDHDGIDYTLIEAAECYVLDTRRRLKGRRDSI